MQHISEGYFDDNKVNGDEGYMNVYDSNTLTDYKFYIKFIKNINDSMYTLHLYEKESNIYLTSQKLSKILDNLTFISDFKIEQTLFLGWKDEWRTEIKVNPTIEKPLITDLDLSEFTDLFKRETGYDYNDTVYRKPNIMTLYSIKVFFNVEDNISFERFFKDINILNKTLYHINLYNKYEIGTIATRSDGIPVYDAEIDAKEVTHKTYITNLYKHFWSNKDNSNLPSLKELAYKHSHVSLIMLDYVQESQYDVELKKTLLNTYHDYKNNRDYPVVFFDLFFTLRKHKELAKNQILAELKEKVFLKLPIYFLRDWRFCIRIKSNKNFESINHKYPKPEESEWTDKRQGRFEQVSNNIGNSTHLTFSNFYKFFYHIDLQIRGYVMFLNKNEHFTDRTKIKYFSTESFANLVLKEQ